MDLSRDDFRALAAGHTVVPVWRELVSDLETPVAAYLKLAGDGPDAAPSFLLESVEHGDTWGRFSFVGRQPSATIVARGGRLEVDGTLPAGVPLDRGVLAAVEGLLAEYRSPVLPDLPPLHGGVVGYLGYDVVREVEHLPVAAARRPRPPRRRPVGDRPRRRLRPLAPAGVPHRERQGHRRHVHRRPRRPLRRGRPAGSRSWPTTSAGRSPTRRRRRPTPRDPLPEVRSTVGSKRYGEAVDVAKEHILAGDIFQVVLSQRFDLDLGADPFDVYRVLRQVNPSPYMYFLRHPSITVVGLVAGADGAAAGRSGRLPAHRRHPPPGRHARGRPPPGRRAARAPQGGGRAHHARRPGPQRRRPGGRRSAPRRWTS